MKKMILAPLVGALIFVSASAAEKSVFGAGDLDSSTPYGLTDSEKVLLKNKKNVDNLGQNVSSVKMQVGTLEEQIDGVRSVLDGTNERVNEMDRRLREVERSNMGEDNTTSVSKQIEELRVYVNESRKLQDTNNRKIKKVINELSTLIDTINSNYVSKSELDKRLNKKSSKPVKKASKPKKSDFSKKSGQELSKSAIKLYKGGKLNLAKEQYEALVAKNYKPANSNFMLGEIEYKQKSWGQAIVYYKKSVELYDKASYMPKLLYHTAISFDKLKDTENANKFYKALKLTYPDSKEAKASPDRK